MYNDEVDINEPIWNVRVRGRNPTLGMRTTWFRAAESAFSDTDAIRSQAELKLAFLNPAGGGPNAWSIVESTAFCRCPIRHYHHV